MFRWILAFWARLYGLLTLDQGSPKGGDLVTIFRITILHPPYYTSRQILHAQIKYPSISDPRVCSNYTRIFLLGSSTD